jgi:hypothetical protein
MSISVHVLTFISINYLSVVSDFSTTNFRPSTCSALFNAVVTKKNQSIIIGDDD